MLKEDDIVWINGELKKFKDISISLFTHALHYGTSVFEGVRSYDGKIFKSEQHSKRLIRSAQLCDMMVNFDYKQIESAMYDVLKNNNLQYAYIRPIIWRGEGEYIRILSKNNKVNVAIMAWFYSGKDSEKISLSKTDFVRPDPRGSVHEAKAGGAYFIGAIAQNKASSDGYNDALMLDWRGYVAECTSSNVFFVKDGKIFTPIADCFLNGITRQTIFEIAKSLNIECNEVRIKAEELSTFDECFVTGTATGVVTVQTIFNEIKYTQFDISNKIKAFYDKLVRQ